MWRVIDMSNDGQDLLEQPYDLQKMCYHAVDRSQGELVDINLEYFANNKLLKYIAERSGQLKRLSIGFCYRRVYKGWSEVVQKLPLLEELSLTHTTIKPEGIEALGRSCPKLKSFELNQSFKEKFYEDFDEDDEKYNEEARAIAKNLPALRHLQLIGNGMTNKGLEAILSGCPHLVSLDLRQCDNVDLNCRISRQIKDFKHPDVSLDGLEFSFQSEDDYYDILGDTSDDNSDLDF